MKALFLLTAFVLSTAASPAVGAIIINKAGIVFKDAQGAVLKSIPLGVLAKTDGVKTIRRGVPLGSTHVARIETRMRFPIPETENSEAIETTSKVELFDVSGNLMWTKELKRGRTVSSLRSSANAASISAVVGCEIGCTQDNSVWTLEVWDKSGETVLAFPRQADDCQIGSNGHWISPTGEYALSSCRGKNLIASAVIDIKKRRIWRSSEAIDVIESVSSDSIRTAQRDTVLSFKDMAWEPIDGKK